MKLLLPSDVHLLKTPDGKYWCKYIFGYSFWERYLNVFENIRIAARVTHVKEKEDDWLRVDAAGIEIFEIPFYRGPKELLKRFFLIWKSLKNVADGCSAIIFRLPSPTGILVYKKVKKMNMPFALEIVANTDEIICNTKFGMSKISLQIMNNTVKKMCRVANGVSYVTERILQKHYPSYVHINRKNKNENTHFVESYSTINIDSQYYGAPKKFVYGERFNLVHTNVSMNTNNKGEKTVLATLKILIDKGYNIKCTFIGDGALRSEFEKYAKELNIYDYVTFTGYLSHSEDVRKILIESDLYFFPSVSEGLPRSLIEAMAVGLPAISTNVGGIPELLDREYLFEPKDVDGFANKIEYLINNTSVLEKESRNNILVAKRYEKNILTEKRNNFYGSLKCLCKSSNNSVV